MVIEGREMAAERFWEVCYMEKTEYTWHADKLAHVRSEMLLASWRKRKRELVFLQSQFLRLSCLGLKPKRHYSFQWLQWVLDEGLGRCLVFCPAPVQSFQNQELDRLFSGKSINASSCHQLHSFWRQSIFPKAHSHLWRSWQKHYQFQCFIVKKEQFILLKDSIRCLFPFQLYINAPPLSTVF